MNSLSPYTFIHTGLIIRLLRHSQNFTVDTIIGEAKKLRVNLVDTGFTVSVAGLNELQDFLKTLEKETTKGRQVSASEVTALSQIMTGVEQMVFAEAQTKQIFVISGKRYSLEYLTGHPDKMFKDGIFGKLPPIAQRDLKEGFRCIVFSRSTAAAFHILRATEAILREYYLTKIKRGRDKVLLWGRMTQALAVKRNSDNKLLQRLEYLKNSFRNPTSHPEAEYNLDEVQDLLGLCVDVINAMGRELPEDANDRSRVSHNHPLLPPR